MEQKLKLIHSDRNKVPSLEQEMVKARKCISVGATLVLSLGLISLVIEAESAIASSHSHRHGSPSPGKEREDDGAYSPRSASHYGTSKQRAGSPLDIDSPEHNLQFDHEAVVGSAKEAEEFDNLPPEEAKRRLKLLLVKMDLDKNGFIERAELKAWILRSFTQVFNVFKAHFHVI